MTCIRTIPDGRKLDIANQPIDLVRLQASYEATQTGELSNDYTFPVQMVETVAGQKIIEELRNCKGKGINAELLENGVPLLRASRLKLIDQIADNSSVQLVGSYYLWRSLLEDKAFCDLFDLGTHPFTSSHIEEAQQWNGDSGEIYTYPSILYGDELMHKPAYFWKQLLIRAFKAVGYDLVYEGPIANLPAFRDLITPHFAGVVRTVKSECIGQPLVSVVGGINPPLPSEEVDLTKENPGEQPCGTNEEDETESIADCLVAYTSSLRSFSTVSQLLDAEPFFFDQSVDVNDPEGLIQLRQIQYEVNDQTNIFEGYTLVPNTRGKYKVKIKFQFYRRREVGIFDIYDYFHTKEITREIDSVCDKPIFMYYTYDFPLTRKFMRVSLCGESEDIYNSLDFNGFAGGDIRIVTEMWVYKLNQPHHVCRGEKPENIVDLNLNCPDLQPLQLVSFLEESLGFMFLETGAGKVSMIHRLDHFGVPHQIGAEDWRDIVDCVGAKETLIRAKFKEFLKFTYQNDDEIPLNSYEEEFAKPLGEGLFEIEDKNNTSTGEQVMNPSNIFSATAMVLLDNGLWLPQIGEAPLDESAPRVLIYEGATTIITEDEETKQYGLSYFYKENAEDDVVMLDYSNTHGLGLIDRFWWRYLQIIACGVEVEASVLLDLLRYQSLQLSAAKFFKSRDANGSLQLQYHFLNSVNFSVGSDEPSSCRFWQIPNLK